MRPGDADAAQQRRIKPVAPTLPARARAFAQSRQTRVYAESVVLTAILPLIGLLVQPADPLFLRNGFSWLALPPILVALRHGFGPGVTSALLLVAMVLFVRRPLHASFAGLPSELLYGVVLVTMIVGQVAAAMARKVDKIETDYRHLRAQFDGFSRSYMLLELSHERLEQRAVSGLSSLRAALGTLFTTLASPAGEGDRDGERERAAAVAVAERALAVMASYGRVQSAGIHLCDAAGELAAQPVAALGAPRPLDAGDSLVLAALETGDVVHSPTNAHARENASSPSAPPTELLAAIPLIDSRQGRLGVVAIRALPFVALESSNLRLLYVVAGYTADAMRASVGDAAARDDQWRQFSRRLERATADARDPRMPSVLMAFSCAKAQRGTQVLEMLAAKDLRSTDFPILRRRRENGDPLLFIVMPLTDRDGTLAFRVRIDRLARERFGADLAALGVATKTWLLEGAKSEDVLDEVVAMEADEGPALAPPSR